MMLNKIQQITVYNICSIRNNKRLFEDINFTIESGDLFEIRGSNGTGKTSLLKMLSGIIQPSRGNIIINQGKISFQEYKEHLVFIDSSPQYRENITLLDYLIYWAILHNNIKYISYTYIYNILNRLGLAEYKDLQISRLSLGQKKRLYLSKLILMNRQIWFLDEPYIGLDQDWIIQFNRIIEIHRTQGGIVLITTHIKINNQRHHLSLDSN